MFTTTSDVLLAFENDPKAVKHSYLDQSSNKNSFNKQHDINNLLLAEIDSYKHSQWIRDQEKQNHETYFKCLNLKFRLNSISKDEDNFNTEIDLNYNEVITYTNQNIVYLPICTPVFDVNLTNTTLCFKDAQVTYKEALLGNSRKTQLNRIGYLTRNNFIRDSSVVIDCSLIHSSQILPTVNQILVRRKSMNSVFNIDHMVTVDLSKSIHSREDINMNHCKEIVNNYQATQLIFEFETFKQNDVDGKFF
jgi:hypothetical protein